jgi:hypothetical protein
MSDHPALREGLKRERPKARSRDFSHRFEMYKAGVLFGEIAKVESVMPKTIYSWVKSRQL